MIAQRNRIRLVSACRVGCLVAGLMACGIEPPEQAGSSEVQAGKAQRTLSKLPWLVTILTPDEDPEWFRFCRGVLVAPNKVLTTHRCAGIVDLRRSSVKRQGAGSDGHLAIAGIDRSGDVLPLTDLAMLTLKSSIDRAEVAPLARWQTPRYAGEPNAATIYDFDGDINDAKLYAHPISLAWRVAGPALSTETERGIYGVVLTYSDDDPAGAKKLNTGSAVVQQGALVGLYVGQRSIFASRRMLAMLDYDEELLARHGLRLDPAEPAQPSAGASDASNEAPAKPQARDGSSPSAQARRVCQAAGGCRITTYSAGCPSTLPQGRAINVVGVSSYGSWLFDIDASTRCAIAKADQRQWH